MALSRFTAALLAISVCVVVLGAELAAQPEATFSAPRRLKAGDAFLGKGRAYPSPAFHDVDGDGLADIVIGDLPGRVTWARQIPGESITFAAEKPFLDKDGKRLDFNNW